MEMNLNIIVTRHTLVVSLNPGNGVRIETWPLRLAPEEPICNSKKQHDDVDGSRIVHVEASDGQGRGEWQPDRQIDSPEQGVDVQRQADSFRQSPVAILQRSLRTVRYPAGDASVQHA